MALLPDCDAQEVKPIVRRSSRRLQGRAAPYARGLDADLGTDSDGSGSDGSGNSALTEEGGLEDVFGARSTAGL